jgi:hypothetical protein
LAANDGGKSPSAVFSSQPSSYSIVHHKGGEGIYTAQKIRFTYAGQT